MEEGCLLEPILRVLNQLPELDHKAPREWSVHVEPLEEDLADLLLYQWIDFFGLLEEAK